MRKRQKCACDYTHDGLHLAAHSGKTKDVGFGAARRACAGRLRSHRGGMGARLNAAIAAGQECIFCGDRVSSEEHVWPHWLKDSKTIDHTPVNHTQSQILVTVDPIGPDAVGPNTRKFDVKRRGGAATNRKEPVVCAPCNNGWMSRLEKKTKKILLPMIDDEPRNLDRDDQRTIARWADKVVMVWETTAPDIAVTTPEDRLRVTTKSPVRPARRTQVWIGRTEHSPTITELRPSTRNSYISAATVKRREYGSPCLSWATCASS